MSVDHARYHSLLPLPSDQTHPAYKQQQQQQQQHAAAQHDDYKALLSRHRVSLYKVTSALDGRCYVLRRLHACRPQLDRVHEAMEPWIDMQREASYGGSAGRTAEEDGGLSDVDGHPALVALRRSFVNAEFGDGGGHRRTARPLQQRAVPRTGERLFADVFDSSPLPAALCVV